MEVHVRRCKTLLIDIIQRSSTTALASYIIDKSKHVGCELQEKAPFVNKSNKRKAELQKSVAASEKKQVGNELLVNT